MPAGVAGAAEGVQRTSEPRLRELAATLSERDRAVLTSIGSFGFLRAQQIQLLHFNDHVTREASARLCRRALARLRGHQLIEPIDRRIGGLRAGSAGYVWRLAAAGDRLLRMGDVAAPRARRAEPSLRFLEHRLAVADVVCELTAAHRVGRFELVGADPEPSSWRPFAGSHGAREVLKPDLYAVTASGDFEDHWFIEVDRATESLATVLKQCEQYQRYRRGGDAQRELGLFPRVLWLVPDSHRQTRIESAVNQAHDLESDLFRVALSEQVTEVVAEGGS